MTAEEDECENCCSPIDGEVEVYCSECLFEFYDGEEMLCE